MRACVLELRVIDAVCICAFQYVCFQGDGEAPLSNWTHLGAAELFVQCEPGLSLQGNKGRTEDAHRRG